MTNIVLITNGSRPRLMEQTLRTLYENTFADQYNLTIVGDGTSQGIEQWVMHSMEPLPDNWSPLIVFHPCYVIGRLKNLGAYWSEKQFGRGEWLCICDDDLAFTPGWLDHMIMALNTDNKLRIVGGVRHPYHKTNITKVHPFIFSDKYAQSDYDAFKDTHRDTQHTDAVAGYLHFMRWSTWDKFGPYADNQKGLGASEDYALCRKVVDAGGAVGYVSPACVYHTGVTNSEGKPILGAELIEKQEGILYL